MSTSWPEHTISLNDAALTTELTAFVQPGQKELK